MKTLDLVARKKITETDEEGRDVPGMGMGGWLLRSRQMWAWRKVYEEYRNDDFG